MTSFQQWNFFLIFMSVCLTQQKYKQHSELRQKKNIKRNPFLDFKNK